MSSSPLLLLAQSFAFPPSFIHPHYSRNSILCYRQFFCVLQESSHDVTKCYFVWKYEHFWKIENSAFKQKQVWPDQMIKSCHIMLSGAQYKSVVQDWLVTERPVRGLNCDQCIEKYSANSVQVYVDDHTRTHHVHGYSNALLIWIWALSVCRFHKVLFLQHPNKVEYWCHILSSTSTCHHQNSQIENTATYTQHDEMMQ